MERAHGIEYRRIRVPYVDIHSIPIVRLILVYIRMPSLLTCLSVKVMMGDIVMSVFWRLIRLVPERYVPSPSME